MPNRYLDAYSVKLSASAPQFVELGCCLWCNQPLTGKAKRFCRPNPKTDIYSNMSNCSATFWKYWYTRPAYQRATFIRDNFTCQACGLHPFRKAQPWLPDLSQLHCDHIVPIIKGGLTELDNLQTLCWRCNLRKGTRAHFVSAQQGKLL